MLAMTTNPLVTPQLSSLANGLAGGLAGGGAARSTPTASPDAMSAATSALALPGVAVAGAPGEPLAGSGNDTYSARTTFDAATGEWAFVIERHPPETGIAVAEQGGFVSQYAATADSAADLRNAFNLSI
jgi:hypothetical protein